MIHDSRYRMMLQPPRVNRGYDYVSSGLVRRFVSARLYGNPMISGFLDYIDRCYIELVESVKKVQFYYNYVLDKNDRSLNL